VADDAAALVEVLGVGPVVTVGYSMGGPVSMLLAHRHPHLVKGVVVQATSLEWKATRRDRAEWTFLPALGWGLRSWWFPRVLRWGARRAVRRGDGEYAVWTAAEFRRNDVANLLEAGRALARYDARPWAGSLGVPAGALITTRDRLVPPTKQQALADVLRAHVVEMRDDHLCTMTSPAEYAAATVQLVRHVLHGA
jgi:pimeloyl-ACP methyl ester carboxylesterase